MSTAQAAPTSTVADTRNPGKRASARRRARMALIRRPEAGALVAAIVVGTFFSAQSPVFRSASGIANWLDPAATLGIMAVAVALLLIGGEFDLSAGVITGATGLVTALAVTSLGLHMWVALALSLLVAILIGTINGLVVVSTGLPSFIVTLATFLVLRGVDLGGTKLFTGTTQIQGISDTAGFPALHALFASTVSIAGANFGVSIFWWLGITAVATYVLQRTQLGSWIFAVGGNMSAARAVGVPVKRVKVGLFISTSVAGWLVGNMILVRLGSVQATTGIGLELIYVVAAVIGGCMLTGGYGSAVGASIGALIFGMAQLGIVYLGWDSDWFNAFLGAMLALAVVGNLVARRLLVSRARL